MYPGDAPGEERLYNSWESAPHLPGDLVETYHHEHPSSGGQGNQKSETLSNYIYSEREYFSKRPRKVELNRELQFFKVQNAIKKLFEKILLKSAFHQQQLRDDARLQEKVSELKQQMEERFE